MVVQSLHSSCPGMKYDFSNRVSQGQTFRRSTGRASADGSDRATTLRPRQKNRQLRALIRQASASIAGGKFRRKSFARHQQTTGNPLVRQTLYWADILPRPDARGDTPCSERFLLSKTETKDTCNRRLRSLTEISLSLLHTGPPFFSFWYADIRSPRQG